MSLRVSRSIVVSTIAAACCVLMLLSCAGSPSSPVGRLLVYVSENGVRPAPGKRIEIRGTSLSQTTDQNGQALFIVPAGSLVVRAYELGTPGPGRPFIEQSVDVKPGRMSRAQFNDCTMCR
jgi:hypothetical protein